MPAVAIVHPAVHPLTVIRSIAYPLVGSAPDLSCHLGHATSDDRSERSLKVEARFESRWAATAPRHPLSACSRITRARQAGRAIVLLRNHPQIRLSTPTWLMYRRVTRHEPKRAKPELGGSGAML